MLNKLHQTHSENIQKKKNVVCAIIIVNDAETIVIITVCQWQNSSILYKIGPTYIAPEVFFSPPRVGMLIFKETINQLFNIMILSGGSACLRHFKLKKIYKDYYFFKKFSLLT